MKQFKEALNTAVFTTRFVIAGNSPITVVFHHQDGSWQFNGDKGDLLDSDYKIISLGEVISLDQTIIEIADMPVGHFAYRDTTADRWKIEPFNT